MLRLTRFEYPKEVKSGEEYIVKGRIRSMLIPRLNWDGFLMIDHYDEYGDRYARETIWIRKPYSVAWVSRRDPLRFTVAVRAGDVPGEDVISAKLSNVVTRVGNIILDPILHKWTVKVI